MKDHFATIPDPRSGPAQQHELLDILMIAVCAMLCGAAGFTDLALWGRGQHAWLKTWLALPNGIPAHDTFNRVFDLIAPSAFAACFQSGTQALRQAVAGELIAIDGHSPRSRLPCGGKRCAAAGPRPRGRCIWSLSGRPAIGGCWRNWPWRTSATRLATFHAITAVPQLLWALKLTGCVVTVDALNCQKSIAQEISEADADYGLALEGNHGTLQDDVKCFLDDAQRRGWRGGPPAFVATVDKDHGRLETRRYWITATMDWLAAQPQWEK